MSTIPAVFILGLVAGAIAVPGYLDQPLRSEMRNYLLMEQNDGPTGKDSVCFKPDYMLNLFKRLAKLERQLDYESVRVDDLELQTKRDRSMAQTAMVHDTMLQETVHGYVNASLKRFGVNTNNCPLDVATDVCQAGTIGHEKRDGSNFPWPKSYHVFFNPPFKNEPKIMYGLVHLDMNSYLRVNVKLTSSSKNHASFEIESWKYPQYLYGCMVRWMACP